MPDNTQSPAISIQPAQIEDLQFLPEVEDSAFGPGGYNLLAFRQYFDLFSNLLYIARTADGHCIGYALAGRATKPPQRGWILSLAVKTEFQSKGVGKQLMHAVHAQLQAQHCQEVLLTVRPDKTHVIRFYESLGYKKYQHHADYFGPNTPRLLMRYVSE